MIVLYGEVRRNKDARVRGDIIAAVKVAVSLSISTRMNVVKAANISH